MVDPVTPAQIYPALKGLLGLPGHLLAFHMHVCHDQPAVIVKCEYYVGLDGPGIADLHAVMAEFELVRRAPEAPDTSAEATDFDAWMRRRTARAHAEFMTRTAAL